MRFALTLASLAGALALGPLPAAAQDFVLALEYESSSSGADGGSSGSSSGRQAIAERVIAARPEGSEVEYTLPYDPAKVRGNDRWMFPARIMVAADGSKTVLNEPELLARSEAWLAEMEWPREVCSRWTFSWMAYQIRCDPAAAIEVIEGYGMQPGRIAEGQAFVLKGALGPVVLARAGEAEGRIILTGSGPVDVAHLREEAAQTALVVAEISGETLTPEEARTATAGINAVGTVSVTFEIDAAGMVWKRTSSSEINVTGSAYDDGTRRSKQTVTRLTRAEWERREAEAEAETADPMADPNPEAEAAEAE